MVMVAMYWASGDMVTATIPSPMLVKMLRTGILNKSNKSKVHKRLSLTVLVNQMKKKKRLQSTLEFLAENREVKCSKFIIQMRNTYPSKKHELVCSENL